MPNPNPKLENLKPFQRKSERALGKIIGTRYPLEVQAILESLDCARQEFIRSAVEEKLKREGLLKG